MTDLVRRKRGNEAWETVRDGGPQPLPEFADDTAAFAALGNSQWMVFSNLDHGGVAEIVAKNANGGFSGLLFDV